MIFCFVTFRGPRAILGFFVESFFSVENSPYICIETKTAKSSIIFMAKRKISRKKLEEHLMRGEVKFSYSKLDGTVREARGTTNLELVPEEWKPTGGTLAHTGTAYFDLDIQEWRSIASSVSKVSLL